MLYAFPLDRTGCGFQRVVWPLSELRGRVPYTVVMPGEKVPLLAEVVRSVAGAPVVKHVEIPDDCSAVLLQRPTSTLLIQCVPFLKQAGIKVIVEIDDDLHALSPKHASYKYLHPDKPSLSNLSEVPAFVPDSLDALTHAIALADLVICSTPALKERYAPGPKGVVLRNRLRSDWRSCLKKNSGGVRTGPPQAPPRVSAINNELVVGWAGVITTHPDDLQILSRALPRLNGLRNFVIAGPKPPPTQGGVQRASRLLGLEPQRIRFTGSVPFPDWLPHIQSVFGNGRGIAVAPLETSAFNRSKSALKCYEYAAAGIPCVVADTPEYSLTGIGLPTPDNYKAWLKAITNLLNSSDLRDELVGKGYEIADANTYALHADEWYDAISPLVEGCT